MNAIHFVLDSAHSILGWAVVIFGFTVLPLVFVGMFLGWL